MSTITLKWKMSVILIETQALVPDNLDGDASVSSENVHNDIDRAYNKFYGSILKEKHLSFYSNEDVLMLDENRTAVPFGRLRNSCEEDLIDIDIGKAFSAAFGSSEKIQIFNEFDIWEVYLPNTTISDFTLYTVYTSKPNLFLNTTYDLVY